MTKLERIQRNQRLLTTIVTCEDAIRLQKLARAYHRDSERLCNGYEKEEHQAKAEQRNAKRLVKARAIAHTYGFGVYEQSDPRGWPFYLYDKAKLRPDDNIESIYDRIGIPVCPL